MKTFTVYSSNGTLEVEIETGFVQKCSMEEDGEDIDLIERFDLYEYQDYYKEVLKASDSIDILELGYWHRLDGRLLYEPADEDWRRRGKEVIRRGSFLYRDGANYKFVFEWDIPQDMNLKVGDEISYKKLGISSVEFHRDIVCYPYNDDDHDIVTLEELL